MGGGWDDLARMLGIMLLTSVIGVPVTAWLAYKFSKWWLIGTVITAIPGILLLLVRFFPG